MYAKHIFSQVNKSRDSRVMGSNNTQDILMETTSIYDGKLEWHFDCGIINPSSGIID